MRCGTRDAVEGETEPPWISSSRKEKERDGKIMAEGGGTLSRFIYSAARGGNPGTRSAPLSASSSDTLVLHVLSFPGGGRLSAPRRVGFCRFSNNALSHFPYLSLRGRRRTTDFLGDPKDVVFV